MTRPWQQVLEAGLTWMQSRFDLRPLREPRRAISLSSQRLIAEIHRRRRELESVADQELAERFAELAFQARSGQPLTSLLPATYALVLEASRRTLGMLHRDVQLAAGIALAERSIVDLATGEGKTLVATLPLSLWALRGEGVWLVTANDYLARRDAEWMRPVYELLGLSVAAVETTTPLTGRGPLYRCDIVYGTAREFGFDFLRDRLSLREWGADQLGEQTLFDLTVQRSLQERLTQRLPAAAVIDEADSVLIDEARTPLILSRAREQITPGLPVALDWAARTVQQYRAEEHYLRDDQTREIFLTSEGRQRLRELVDRPALMQFNDLELARIVERALVVDREYLRGRDYLIQEQEVVIIDPLTGRPGQGRRWQAGIHEALEAKERLPIQPESGQLARITIQELFRQIPHLCGMTGTALEAAGELWRTYRTRVVPIPTDRPVQRIAWPTRITVHRQKKWELVRDRCQELVSAGRAVLVGTKSVADSETLAGILRHSGLRVQVLNAERLAEEAEIVSQAGTAAAITISTSMAGRGTDIQLADDVRAAGGLHLIATELFESSRVDRQLRGRCGRQGDPGSFESILSCEDDLLKQAFGEATAARLLREGNASATDGLLDPTWMQWHLRAQRRLERKHRQERNQLDRSEQARRRMDRELGLDPWLDSIQAHD